MKKTLAFVTIGYSDKIVGGAETLIRHYCELLAEDFEVTVITTRSIDAGTWKNELKTGKETINGVTILRFTVEKERSFGPDFMQIKDKAFNHPEDILASEEFIKENGPYSKKLFEYLESNKDTFDYFVYCPYLYATTYFGLQITPKHKNIMISAAHDEPEFNLPAFKKMFGNASKIIILTSEEGDLIHNKIDHDAEVIEIGMHIESVKSEGTLSVQNKLKQPYIVYLGRIQAIKGVDKLLEFFIKYKQDFPDSRLNLLLAGKSNMNIPERKDINYIGFVSEAEKTELLENSLALIQSSKYESFSIVTLEAMLAGRPVMVNAESEVLKGHIIKSGAGFYYTDYDEFSRFLRLLEKQEFVGIKAGIHGKEYIKDNYSREVIKSKLKSVLS